ARLRRGGRVISVESAATGSSAAKGESLEDAVRIIGGYADLIVLRHPEIGAAERAARVSPVPLVNAGDGAGHHPTQALLDLYTIKKECGRHDQVRSVSRVDAALMRRLPEHAIVMHPLPRLDEIDESVDSDPRAAYFRQARNGLFVRMAVLYWLAMGT